MAKQDDSTADLQQVLINDGCDETIVNSLSDLVLTEIASSISEWTQPSDTASNSALNTILYNTNIQGKYSDVAIIASIAIAYGYDLELPDDYDEDDYNPQILDPTDLIYYTNVLYSLIYVATARFEFAEFSLYYNPLPYWSISSNASAEGLVIALYNDQFCNFFAQQDLSSFQALVPSNTICQTPPIITQISPSVAAIGDQITIGGYNFDSETEIHIGLQSTPKRSNSNSFWFWVLRCRPKECHHHCCCCIKLTCRT